MRTGAPSINFSKSPRVKLARRFLSFSALNVHLSMNSKRYNTMPNASKRSPNSGKGPKKAPSPPTSNKPPTFVPRHLLAKKRREEHEAIKRPVFGAPLQDQGSFAIPLLSPSLPLTLVSSSDPAGMGTPSPSSKVAPLSSIPPPTKLAPIFLPAPKPPVKGALPHPDPLSSLVSLASVPSHAAVPHLSAFR